MHALLGSYRWDWKDLRAELPAIARAWLPCDPGDLIGPGIAVDETAQLKDGDATACVAPRHAGCTGHVENCVTTVFSAWVATSGQARADFDVFMPGRWERDWQRCRAARIPGGLGHKTKPQLAIGQLNRLLDAGLPAKWAAYDEVYGRSSELRRSCESRNLAYVAVVPCDFRVTLPSRAVIRADQAVRDAAFELRSCGNGSKGPRFADWALIATSSPRHFLLIRRLISRPDDLTFYLCRAPEDTPAAMTFFITIAGRRGPVEQTFKTGKDTLGWDQCQARAWDAVCRHTALAALAQLRQAAVRNHLGHADIHHHHVRVGVPDQLYRLGAGSGLAGHVDIGCLLDQHPQARADQRLIVGQDDPDGHRAGAGSGSRTAMRKPPPGRGPAEKSPLSSAARSRMQ